MPEPLEIIPNLLLPLRRDCEQAPPGWDRIDYPFAAMQIGDGFYVRPENDQSLIVAQNCLTFAASQHKKVARPGWNYKSRSDYVHDVVWIKRIS